MNNLPFSCKLRNLKCFSLLFQCTVSYPASKYFTLHKPNYLIYDTSEQLSHGYCAQKKIKICHRFQSNMRNENCLKNKSETLSSFIVNKSPKSMQPYLKLMRFDKPTGTLLLYWPCAWSIAFAAQPGMFPDIKMLILFGIGAITMRGAGCTINDIWDKDIDEKVSRTKDRPLVTGEVSQSEAVIFLMAQLGASLMVLLQLNWYSVVLGASSLGLVLNYPLLKRVTYWPQFVLGLTFNWGALLGYSSIHSEVNWSICLPLYISGVCWTIIYDTIYAHQDRRDDQILGLKSTAIKFGDHTKMLLSLFSIGMITGLITSGLSSGQTWPYYGSLAAIAGHLASQLYYLDINDPASCGRNFASNINIGLLLFTGIVLGNLLRLKQKA